MNFLAHLSLSNNHDDVLIGNFIADSTKSSEHKLYNAGIVYGIKLHHKIDAFTDSHSIVDTSKQRLRAKHGKYASVIVDIFYDHFLAKNYSLYGEFPLTDFVQRCYALFDKRFNDLSPTAQRIVPHMKKWNWLVNYANEEGLRDVFNGMSRRASFENSMHLAVDDLLERYDDFYADFKAFYPELQKMVNLHFKENPV